MAEKKKNEFTDYIGFLFQSDKEKWIAFSVELTDGKVYNFKHKAFKQHCDFLGNKCKDPKCYTQLIYIDKIENITVSSDNVKLKVLKNG